MVSKPSTSSFSKWGLLEADGITEDLLLTTVLPGKRVDFDHCVISADFIYESCMYSVLIFTVRSVWLDYLHAKLWSVMNYHLASGEENVRNLCIFMLG